jgi:hypothetical protein
MSFRVREEDLLAKNENNNKSARSTAWILKCYCLTWKGNFLDMITWVVLGDGEDWATWGNEQLKWTGLAGVP